MSYDHLRSLMTRQGPSEESVRVLIEDQQLEAQDLTLELADAILNPESDELAKS